jgi:hypothetical protein
MAVTMMSSSEEIEGWSRRVLKVWAKRGIEAGSLSSGSRFVVLKV